MANMISGNGVTSSQDSPTSSNVGGPLQFMRALSDGQWTDVAELLTHQDMQCSVLARDAGGNTALHLACHKDDTPADIIIGLLQRGADPLAVNEAKQTAFEVAVYNHNKASAHLIVPYLPEDKINGSLPSGGSHFQIAQQAGDKASMAALIIRGADIGANAKNMARQAHDQQDDMILAALVGVVKQSVLDMLDIEYKRMVEAGLPKSAAACLKRNHHDISVVADDQQQNFVHQCAAEGGTYQLCVELLALGVPINAVDINGNTPLHTAAKHGNLGVAKALCEHGADVMARNKNNRTPKMVPKISSDLKDFLYDMEELHKEGKLQQRSKLWDEKMAATQTQSAFGIRAL